MLQSGVLLKVFTFDLILKAMQNCPVIMLVVVGRKKTKNRWLQLGRLRSEHKVKGGAFNTPKINIKHVSLVLSCSSSLRVQLSPVTASCWLISCPSQLLKRDRCYHLNSTHLQVPVLKLSLPRHRLR